MADYKEIISSTIKNLADKVKDAAENTKVREVYNQGIERTKNLGTIAKLKVAIAGDTEELKRVYREIGKLYYEENKGAPAEAFSSLFSKADALNESITAKESDISALKADMESASESDIDVEICEFEEVVNETESDGVGKEDAVSE